MRLDRILMALLLCLLGNAVFAQKYGRVFQDYEQCLEGVVSISGDTIIPASYDKIYTVEVYQLVNKENVKKTLPYWIVDNGGLQGILSFSGLPVLELSYDNIQFLNDSICTLGKDRQYQLYNLNKKTSSETFDRISSHGPNRPYFTVEKDQKRGQLNFDFSTRVPIKFRIIEFLAESESTSESPEKHLLYRALDVKFGVINDQNDTIIPFEYDVIDKRPIYSCRDRKGTYLMVHRNHKRGALSLDGKTLVPPNYDGINLFYGPSGTCDNPEALLAKVWSEEGMKIINTTTGISSQLYENIEPLENWYIAIAKKKSYILDEFFKPIHSVSRTNYVFGDHYMPRVRHYNKQDSVFEYYSVRPNDSIIHIGQREERKRIFGLHYLKSKGEVRLLNYQTNAAILTEHSRISIVNTNNERIYWGWDIGRKSPNITTKSWNKTIKTLTIYDDKFNPLKTIEFRDILPKKRISNAIQSVPDTNLIFLQNTEGKYGAISPHGEVVTPFQFDALHPDYLREMNKKSIRVYHVSIDEKHGLISDMGVTLLPCVYDRLILGSVIRAYRGDTVLQFDFNMNLLSESSTTLIYPDETLRHYYAQNDTLYYGSETHKTRVDSMSGYRIYNYKLVDRYIINKEGYILKTLNSRRTWQPDGAIPVFIDDRTIWTIDSNEQFISSQLPDEYFSIPAINRRYTLIRTGKKRNKYGVILNENMSWQMEPQKKVVIQLVQPDSLEYSPPKPKYFDSDGYLHYGNKKLSTLVDSNITRFPSEYRKINRYVIDPTGQILHKLPRKRYKMDSESERFYHYGRTFTCIYKDRVDQIKLQHEVTSVASYDDEILWVFAEKKVDHGIYSVKERRWIFEPGANDAVYIQRGNREVISVVNDEKVRVYDRTGESLLPFELDFVPNFRSRGLTVIRSNGFYGMIDSAFQVVIPPKYVYIQDIGIAIIAQEKLGESKELLTSAIYKDSTVVIGTGRFTKLTPYRFLFRNQEGTYSILNETFEKLVNNVTLEELVSNYSVPQLLDIEHRYIYKNIAFATKPWYTEEPIIAEQIAHWMEIFHQNNITPDFDTITDLKEYIDPETEYLISCFGKYAVLTSVSKNRYSRYVTRDLFTLGKAHLKHTTCASLLVPNKKSELRKLLTAEIQERQSFGLTCVDLEGELDALISNFVPGDSEVHFYAKDNRFTISIPSTELDGIINL